ncbi:beta-phosphoglucomutase family hydrolase [Pasteurellaceae bacterium LIM206]|nr:beta-phosphoglucomutase family hydrolase [Pasteurellaceae bacterium LIM206]
MFDTNIFQSYKGFIFDMDGTIIDTMPSHALAWEKVGEHLGYPIKGDVMYEYGGAPVKVIAQETIKRYGIPHELLNEIIRLKRKFGFELVEENATLLPTMDIIYKYKNSIPMALGTGSHKNMVDMLLERFDLRQYFAAVVTADDVETHKPSPETFLRCANLLQVKPQHCIVFEDADLGVQAGLDGGIDVFDVRIQQIIKAK